MRRPHPSRHACLLGALLLTCVWSEAGLAQDTFIVEAPSLVLTGVPFEIRIIPDGPADLLNTPVVRLDGAAFTPTYSSEDNAWIVADAETAQRGGTTLELVQQGTVIQSQDLRSLPGWFSIVPPLLAILIALLFKRVIPALFLGIWVGAWGIAGLTWGGLVAGLFQGFEIYVRGALADTDHASIILFTLMIGGMVGIISKNGGTQGIVNIIVTWARTPQRGQLVTWMLGLVIFFDDYANTLVVGKTMRPITDRLKISREKLAYIVDSTAAPVASLALVTTWIGYEVGLIGDAVEKIGAITESAYSIFLNSLAYSFYPILAIFFVFLVSYSRRDYGPMYAAEQRARKTGRLTDSDAQSIDADEDRAIMPLEGKPQRAFNAIVPVIVLILGVVNGLFRTGEGDTIREIIGSADSYVALLWASLASVLAAALLSTIQGILTLEETVEAWYAGLKSMMFAMIILLLAWSLSAVTEVLHTADYLVSVLGDSLLPGFLPALIFILAAATGFSTGSSWGAMGILMPLVIPLVWAVMQANGMTDPEHFHIIYSTVSCVLAGSVWGDHCSPISDTTILSSMASSCDHIDHVRTQLPYAMSVGAVAILLGTLPTGFGFPWWIALPLGMIVLFTCLRVFGKVTEDEPIAV